MEPNANSSSSSSSIPLNSSDNSFVSSCFNTEPSSSVFIGFTITNLLLLLPLSIFILFLGLRRSSVPVGATEVFTLHMASLELVGMCGSVVCCCGAATNRAGLLTVGCNMFAITSCVKMYFHVLTCVERYVAVVHPLAYLRLSQSGGATIRNISISCVWLADAVLVALRILTGYNFTVMLFFSNLAVSLAVSSFCSVSVLRVLRRPGPGDEGANKPRRDEVKHRALVTISAIMAVLLLRFGGNLVCISLAASSLLGREAGCVVQVSGVWFCLPSSYVLPLLFLQRGEQLPCSRPKS